MAMTKEEYLENLLKEHVTDINATWRQDELLPGTISGVVPEYPLDKKLNFLMAATKKGVKPVLDSAPKREGFKVFGMFNAKKPKSADVAPSDTPTPKKPR